MDENSFEQLLRQRCDQPHPSLPPNFQQDVWREIRQRRFEEGSAFGTFAFWQSLLRPRFLAASLAAAIVIGVSMGALQRDRSAETTKHALHLEVFGTAAPALPSTILASNL